jgi:hypothetical protein
MEKITDLVFNETLILLSTSKQVEKTRSSSLAYTALENVKIFLFELAKNEGYKLSELSKKVLEIKDINEEIVKPLETIKNDLVNELKFAFPPSSVSGILYANCIVNLTIAKYHFSKCKLAITSPQTPKKNAPKPKQS